MERRGHWFGAHVGGSGSERRGSELGFSFCVGLAGCEEREKSLIAMDTVGEITHRSLDGYMGCETGECI